MKTLSYNDDLRIDIVKNISHFCHQNHINHYYHNAKRERRQRQTIIEKDKIKHRDKSNDDDTGKHLHMAK